LDGPAVEWNSRIHGDDGLKEWFVDGKQCSEQEFPIVVIMFLLNCDKKAAKLILENIRNANFNIEDL
jgi:hypothetical protein